MPRCRTELSTTPPLFGKPAPAFDQGGKQSEESKERHSGRRVRAGRIWAARFCRSGHRLGPRAAYPSKPVRPTSTRFPAGGRRRTRCPALFCAKMSELTGQQWLVENKGGSGGKCRHGCAGPSRRPDGYALGLGGIASHAHRAPTLYARLAVQPAHGLHIRFDPSGQLPQHAGSSTSTCRPNRCPKLIEASEEEIPANTPTGSAGVGARRCICRARLFKIMAKVDMVHVPYRGAGARHAGNLLAGQIHMIFDNIPGRPRPKSAPRQRCGPLGVTFGRGARPLVPDVPAIRRNAAGPSTSTRGPP